MEQEHGDAPDAGRILEKESLGEFLRKVRIGNRVDLQKMAKDTRLSLEYIQAIEKNEFDKIPGETYRKIFIKNIAKYLELNPDEIYARYQRDTLPPAPVLPGEAQPAAAPVAAAAAGEPARGPEAPLPPKSNKPILITLAGILVILLIIVSQSDKKAVEAPPPPYAPIRDTMVPSGTGDSGAPAESAPASERAKDSATGLRTATEPMPDTMSTATPAASDTQPAKAAAADTVKPAPAAAPAAAAAPDTAQQQGKPHRFAPESNGSIKVELTCTRDSVYAYAYRNGKVWFNLFKINETKVFAGDTALYFRLSTPQYVTLKYNGSSVVPAPLRNKPVIRIDGSSITYHSVKEWDKVTRKR